MKKSIVGSFAGLLFPVVCLSDAGAQSTVTWDGGGLDGLWETATNWDGDVLPAAGDDVVISNGDSVAGAEFNTTYTITLSGGSSLTDPVTSVAGGAWRAGGATIIVNSGSTLGSGGFWDFQDATLTFKDGAAVNMSNWEHKGTNVFNFDLSASGFTPLTPGGLIFGGGATIADATYNVDMAAYIGTTSAVITLIDFAVDGSGMTDAIFQGAGGLNILNPPVGATTSLRWSDAADAVELVVNFPNTWTGGNANWKVDGNWSSGSQPGAGEFVVIGSGNTVTYDGGGNLPNSLNIELDGTLTNSGQGAIRLAGSTIEVGSTGELAGDFWDLGGGTLIFDDGAKASMGNWEQKGTNVFQFNLGTSGFTTLTPGTLRNDGNNVGETLAEKMAKSTYVVDFTNYTGGAATITLIDYSSDASGLDDATFQNANFSYPNLDPSLSAALQWNDTDDSIELVISSATTPLPSITGITLDGSGDVILTLDGPAAGLTAQRSDDLSSFADVASTPSGNTLTIDSSLVDPNADGKDFYRVRD